MADAELSKICEQAEYLQEPKNHGNHHNGVQDSLDLTLHGDEAVHEPHQDAYYEECEYNGYKRHIIFSFSCLAKCVFQEASVMHSSPSWVRMEPWNPRQVAGQHVYGDRRRH
jgi:hypothetical protein